MSPIFMEQLARIRRQNLDEELARIYRQRIIRNEPLSVKRCVTGKFRRLRAILDRKDNG